MAAEEELLLAAEDELLFAAEDELLLAAEDEEDDREEYDDEEPPVP